MSAGGIPIYVSTLVNASGAPRSGARIYSYVPDSAGAPTATARTLFTSPDAVTTPAANPYVMGTSGQGVLYKPPGQGVVIVIKGAEGAADAGTTYATVHYPAGVTVDSLGDEWLELLELDAQVFHVDAYGADPTGVADSTDAIQAASAALEAAGSGILRGTYGGTYKVYPDTSDTSSLGDFDNCKGVYLDFNGCTFTIAREFTGSQSVFGWVFEGCDGFGWSDHTVVCDQVDIPDLSWTRGMWWIAIGDRNSMLRAGSVKMTGGRLCVDIYRASATVTNRLIGGRIKRIETIGVGYPFGLRNSGDDVIVEEVDATDATRIFIGYGFRNLRAHMTRRSTGTAGESDFRIEANGTGSALDLGDPVTEGVFVKYKAVEAPTNAPHFVIEARGTSALTLRDIHIDMDITFGSGGSSQMIARTFKRSDASTFDSTVRGHALENVLFTGIVRDAPANAIIQLFDTTLGDWAGETISNFRIRDLIVTGSASSSYTIDFDGFTDGPTFDNFTFPGTVTRTGTIPDTFVEIGVKDAGGHRPLRFGNPRLAARSAGLPYPLAAITTAQTAVTGSTSETNLHTAITVPAGALGANGELRLSGALTMTNNANAKTLRVKYGGTTFATAALASGAGYRFEAVIKNRNSAAAQNGGLSGSGLLDSVTGTVNTANALDVQLTMELADAGDSVTLQDLSVDLVYRA